MPTEQVTVEGWIRQDGLLQVEQRLNLPPGPVHVTVQVASPPVEGEDTRKALEAIWAERKALGLRGRSKEELDAQIDALRNESEEEIREAERLYGEARRVEG